MLVLKDCLVISEFDGANALLPFPPCSATAFGANSDGWLSGTCSGANGNCCQFIYIVIMGDNFCCSDRQNLGWNHL